MSAVAALDIRVSVGDPDATELAVIAAVLHRRAAASAAAAAAHAGPPRVPAWLQAARIEGVGQARISSPADLRTYWTSSVPSMPAPRWPGMEQ